MADTKQTNFSGGELSPLLWGRTDLPIFQNGCRTLKNFFVTKHGVAMTRPGTTLVNTAKFAPNTAPPGDVRFSPPVRGYDRPRLIPFNVSDSSSFVLEFGAGYIRFHTLGATVLAAPGGLPYEVPSPFLEADLWQLKWAQIGEVLTLTCPNHDPYDLRRISDAPPSWSLAPSVTSPLTPGFSVPGFGGADYGIDLAIDRHSLSAADPDHQGQPWAWAVSIMLKRVSDGEIIETLSQPVLNGWDSTGASYAATVHPISVEFPTGVFVVYPDKPVTLTLFEVATAIDYSAYVLVAFNVYRGRGTLKGLVGSVATTGENAQMTPFVDVGDTPNYAIQPPQGRNPFGPADPLPIGQTEVTHAQRPNAVCYFQQRKVYGGLRGSTHEQDLEISKLGDFNGFDQPTLIDVSGEALQVTLAARRRGVIKHLVSLRRLLILGSASSYNGGGTSQLPLDYNAMDFPLIEEVGAADVQPLVVDGACLFVRTLGRGARALVPAQDGYNYDGVDMTWMAEHLFRGLNLSLVDWSYAQEPWDTIWAARGDGALLSLTVSRAQQMVAWAHHQTGTTSDPAFVESVCAVREGDEDAVYLIVYRTINGVGQRNVERMTSRHQRGGAQLGSPGPLAAPAGLSVPPDFICMDSAIPYIGPAAQTFTGLGALEGKQVYILAQGNPVDGPYTVVGGSITAGAQYQPNVTGSDGTQQLVLYIGMRFVCTLEVLDIAGAEARAKWKTVTHVGIEVDNSNGIKFGQVETNMYDQGARQVADNFNPSNPITDFIWVPVAGTWDQKARAIIKQTLPYPTTLVGVTRRFQEGT